MAINKQKVCEIIKEKIDGSSGTSRRERISYAFDMISVDRENWSKGDPNYAVAEHYLFARWITGLLGSPGLILLTVANFTYSVVKSNLQLLGLEQLLRFGKGPVTPVSLDDFIWAERGANDGLGDTNVFHLPKSGKPDYPPACQ